MVPSASSPIIAIQILRAIAALMVVVHHAQHEAGLLAARAGSLFVRNDWLPWMAGVDIFFVISGFIMVHASARLFGQRGAAATFLRRRLWRIVPLYWLTTTLFLAVVLLRADVLNSAPAGWSEILASYLFIPAARADGSIQPVFSLGWTLNYEMLFYLLFAAALMARLGAGATVAVVALALAGLVLAARLLALPLPLSWWGQPIVLEFAAGMAIGLLRARGVDPGGPARLLLAGVGVALLAAQALVQPAPLAALGLSGLAATCLVAAAALGQAPALLGGRAGAALGHLGDASYALYLTHPFVLRAGRELLSRLGLTSPPLFIALMLLAACLVALLVYRGFERPVTRLGQGARPALPLTSAPRR